MIKSAIKRFGYIGFIENVIIHCFQKIRINLNVMELFAYELLDSYEYKVTNDVKFLELSDFENQAHINPLWFTPQKIDDIKLAFALGDNIPFGILEKDLIIAYGWVSLKKFGLENTFLKEQDGYLWDDYTHPNYRGQGFHSIINQARVAFLCSKGKKRALTQVAHYNRASRIGYLRNGFNLLSIYFQIKVGSFKYSTLKYNQISNE